MVPESGPKPQLLLMNSLKHILLIISQLLINCSRKRHKLALNRNFPGFKARQLLLHLIHIVKVLKVEVGLYVLGPLVHLQHQLLLCLLTVIYLCLQALLERLKTLHHIMVTVVLELSLLFCRFFDLALNQNIVVLKVLQSTFHHFFVNDHAPGEAEL